MCGSYVEELQRKTTIITQWFSYLPIRKQRSLLFVATPFLYGCLDEFCLMHLVACVTTKAIYNSVPFHSRGEFRFLNPNRDFQRLRTSDFMLKFIYHAIRSLFNRCSCLLQRNRWTIILHMYTRYNCWNTRPVDICLNFQRFSVHNGISWRCSASSCCS